ncbi:MAG: hybrid sensor histidine kinase/response regulator [Verrucomicrobia bacterium]|nr:hybrid sensor histidine kinase/response regulator [Verrucomicrobiota bacterium]
MQSLYDYKKFAILYVDDEEKSLKYFTLALSDQFRIFTAPNAEEGFKLFEEHKDEIAVLMTDQRMPGEKGVQLLERVRHARPRIIRMLATAYSDIEAAISAVNTGSIYKYIHKPWDVPQLEVTLKRALEFYMVQMERDHLLHEKLSVLQNIIITDRVISLGVLAAGLSHHIRNSLVAVRTFLDLAPVKLREENVSLEALRNPNYWQEFYDHVQTQVRRIMQMLSEVGAVSEMPMPVFKDAVQLHEVIGSALVNIKSDFESRNIQIDNKIPASLPVLQVDAKKFQRIFELLLKDEAISLKEGSLISLTAEMTPASAIKITIQDNGAGMPQNDLRSVFNPFFLRSDNPQEFGLNLMTCYFLIYHHGGSIVVNNVEGQGTAFELLFPTLPPDAQAEGQGRDFITKVLANEELWEKLLSGD